MVADRALKASVLTIALMVACLAWAGGTQAQLLPHFKCYVITPGTALNQDVVLSDQFREESVTVRAPHLLCTPVCKRLVDPELEECEEEEQEFGQRNHLKCYDITPSGPPVNERVIVFDQFHPEEVGGESVTVRTPHFLCTPARKILEESAPRP